MNIPQPNFKNTDTVNYHLANRQFAIALLPQGVVRKQEFDIFVLNFGRQDLVADVFTRSLVNLPQDTFNLVSVQALGFFVGA